MLLTFRAANGFLHELETAGSWDCSPWFSDIEVIGLLTGQSPDEASIRQLAIAERGNCDALIADALSATVYQQLAYQGGEFLIASSSVEGVQGMALWRGPYHEIYTYLPYSVSLNPTDALSQLEGLDFDDSVEGLVVTPQPGGDDTIVVKSSSIHVEGVGRVELIPGSEAVALIPLWEGLEVLAGELWQILAALGVAHLLLATPTAAVVVSPGEFDPNDAVAFVEAILQATVNELVGS